MSHPQSSRDPEDQVSPALRYWREQEEAPLPDYMHVMTSEPAPWPGGWWLAPALAASAIVWVLLGSALVG
jgi:hypothetical protein